jgi:predicted amidohydrolase
MMVIGLIEVEEGRLFNTAIVVDHGALIGRYRKMHLLGGEQISTPEAIATSSRPPVCASELTFATTHAFPRLR